MKPHTEMIEGPEAWDRFKSAMKAILKVPKAALPPTPFGKRSPKKSKKKDVKQLPAALCAVFAVCAVYSLVEMIKDISSGRSHVNGLLSFLLFTVLTCWAGSTAKEDRE